MQPNNPQPQVDPTALNLSRAIRDAEGGDYNNTSGDAGTSAGAYQWNNGKIPLQKGQIPANFRSSAQRNGLNPDDFSQTNQDHVAYEEIKKDLDSGLSQSQIAAKWNSGLTHGWETHKGTTTINGKTISYDTPAYVDKVKNSYLKYSQGTQPQGGNGYVDPSQAQAPQQQGGNGYVQPPPITANANASAPDTSSQGQGGGIMGSLLKGAGDVYNAVASPFLGLAALPVQAGVAGYNALTGSHVADPFAKGVPSIAGTNTNVTPLGVEQKLGDAAQVGSYFVPGSGVLGAAGMGALQGGGAAMSAGKDLPEVGVAAGLGAGLGAGAAGATKLLGVGLDKAGGLVSGKAATEATTGIRNAYASALNLNASERAFESRSGKDLAQVLVDNGAALGRHDNGTLDANAAIQTLQDAMKPFNEQAKQALSNPQGVVKDISLPDVLNQVKARIQELPISQLEKNAAMTHAKQVIQAEADQYGHTVTPEIADQIKQGMWGSSFRGKLTTADKLQGNVSYLTGNTLKTEIEKAVAGTDAGDVLPAINKQRSDLADAIKRLTNLDGARLLKGGRLGNMSGGLIGTITGAASGLGAPGALAGDYFGTKAAEFLNNPATKIGVAKLKAQGAGLLPSLLGKGAVPVGEGISKVGSAVKRGARASGLVTNLLTKTK